MTRSAATRILLCFQCFALIACGGPPSPAAPTGPTRNRELALGPPAAAPAIEPEKRFIVLFQGERLPDAEAFGVALATANVTAGVGDLGEGLEVDSAGVRCRIERGERPGSDVLPSPKISPEYARHGLSEAEALALDASTFAANVACRPGGPPAQAGVVAMAVTGVLAAQTRGLVHDPQTGRLWSGEAWQAARSERGFRIAAMVVAETRGDGERRLVTTRGLSAFGRAELAIAAVRASDTGAVAARLLVLADALVQGEPVGAGADVSMGPVTIILLDPAAVAPFHPAATSLTVAPTLMLADPDARPGDLEGVDAFVRRLTL